MICDNGETVEAIIHPSNTKALHVTTDNRIFVVLYIERDGEVIIPVRPGFDLDELVNCETVEFDLTVAGFFTRGPRARPAQIETGSTSTRIALEDPLQARQILA